MKVYIDGKLYPPEEAKISVWDHGLLYGDGVFEGIRVYQGGIFKLDEHLQRLYESARVISLDIPLSFDALRQAVIDTVRVNLEEENWQDAYIRLVVTRGVGDLGLDPNKCKKPTVIIIVDKISLYPRKYYEEGLSVIVSSYRRPSADILSPRIKSLNYLNNILAKLEANLAGVQEAILLNDKGYITECTADNIFAVKSGCVLTPPPIAGILEGITRATVIELCRKLDIPCIERMLDIKDLLTADEVFLTGTGAEIVPVVRISGVPIGTGKPGSITKQLIKAFREEIPHHLTYVTPQKQSS